jgi:hypothetical protein
VSFAQQNFGGCSYQFGKAVFGIVLLLSTLSLSQNASAVDPGVITKPSIYSVQETIERFENAVKTKGQIVFGRVDHAEAAANQQMYSQSSAASP